MNLNEKMGKINPKEVLSVWLDVSSKKIDVCFWIESWDIYLQVKNNSEDLIVLTDCWFTVKEINPIITKHYINHNLIGTKTDKTDSKALAKI